MATKASKPCLHVRLKYCIHSFWKDLYFPLGIISNWNKEVKSLKRHSVGRISLQYINMHCHPSCFYNTVKAKYRNPEGRRKATEQQQKISMTENSHNSSWQMQLPLACSWSWDWQIPAGQSALRDIQSSQAEGLWCVSGSPDLLCCSMRNIERDFLHYLPWPSRVDWMAHIKPSLRLMLGVGILNSWLGWGNCRLLSEVLLHSFPIMVEILLYLTS